MSSFWWYRWMKEINQLVLFSHSLGPALFVYLANSCLVSRFPYTFCERTAYICKISFVGIMYRRESSSFFLRNFYSKEAAITWWFAAATWLERQFYHQFIFLQHIHFLRTQIQEYILVQFIVFLHAERVKYKGELKWWTRVARWYEVIKRSVLELLLLLSLYTCMHINDNSLQ